MGSTDFTKEMLSEHFFIIFETVGYDKHRIQYSFGTAELGCPPAMGARYKSENYWKFTYMFLHSEVLWDNKYLVQNSYTMEYRMDHCLL
jgi:hypothetical protein